MTCGKSVALMKDLTMKWFRVKLILSPFNCFLFLLLKDWGKNTKIK